MTTSSNTKVTHLSMSKKRKHVGVHPIVGTMDRISGIKEYNSRANQNVLRKN